MRDKINSQGGIRWRRKIADSSLGVFWIALFAFIALVLMSIGCYILIYKEELYYPQEFYDSVFVRYIFAALKITFPLTDMMTKQHILSFFILGLGASFLTPLLVTVMNNFVAQKIEKYREGRKVYSDLCGHHVLIGYNRHAITIINNLFSESDKGNVVILTTLSIPQIRKELCAKLPSDIEKRIILYSGDPLSEEKIGTLNLNTAKSVYILDESDAHSSQYLPNLSILKSIASKADMRANNPLVVYMQLNNSTAYYLLQRVDIPTSILSYNHQRVIDLRPFNFYENWSRLLWGFHKLPQYDTLDFEPLEDTDKYVHLVLSDFNNMGRALFLEALRICHYPNFDETTKKNKTIISVFDAGWQEKKDSFFAQYPSLDPDRESQLIYDIDIHFYDMDINHPQARKMIADWSQDKNQLLTIAICEKDPDMAMLKGLNLPEEVYFQKRNFHYIDGDKSAVDDTCEKLPVNESRTRVLIRQEQPQIIDELFAPNEKMQQYGIQNHATYPHVKLFGMVSEGICESQLDDTLPICINGIYSESQEGTNLNIFNYESLRECLDKIVEVCGNDKDKLSDWKKKWLELSEDYKWANRSQADMYKLYMDTLHRFSSKSQAEQETIRQRLAQAEHRRWLADRVVAGWRQIDNEGDKRINERRIHTLFVPFADLSDAEKIKDYNVIATAELLVNESKRLKKESQKIR